MIKTQKEVAARITTYRTLVLLDHTIVYYTPIDAALLVLTCAETSTIAAAAVCASPNAVANQNASDTQCERNARH